MAMNAQRREDIARKIAAAGRYRSFRGATVLEIGADKEGISARMLADAGAARVISANTLEGWPERKEGAIEWRRLDARCIDRDFEPESLDIIFGVAILEHIHGLDRFFAGAKHALRGDGMLFAHGGPIWTSANGHHVGLLIDGQSYRFGNRALNPVRDWTHLALSRSEMVEDLAARDVPRAHAEAIAQQIYESENCNRVGYRAMREAFDGSGLGEIERIENAFAMPPPELLAAIERGPYGDQQRYDVSGITFVARR